MDNLPLVLVVCAVAFAILATFAWLFIRGATMDETPRPKGLDNGNA